jgi:hypothetical protein
MVIGLFFCRHVITLMPDLDSVKLSLDTVQIALAS